MTRLMEGQQPQVVSRQSTHGCSDQNESECSEEKCVGARLGEIVTSIADRCRRARHLGYQRQSWRTSDRDGLRSWQSLQQPRLESLISVYSAPRATTMSFFAAQSARSCF